MTPATLPIPAGKSLPIEPSKAPHILRFTAMHDLKGHQDFHYFVAHGDSVTTARTKLTLIAETTTDRTKATVFENELAATAAWDRSGRPDNWEVFKV